MNVVCEITVRIISICDDCLLSDESDQLFLVEDNVLCCDCFIHQYGECHFNHHYKCYKREFMCDFGEDDIEYDLFEDCPICVFCYNEVIDEQLEEFDDTTKEQFTRLSGHPIPRTTLDIIKDFITVIPLI